MKLYQATVEALGYDYPPMTDGIVFVDEQRAFDAIKPLIKAYRHFYELPENVEIHGYVDYVELGDPENIKS